MIKRSRSMTMWVCLLSLAAIGTATLNGSQGSETLSSGAVYLLTNQIANAVAVFQRAPDGTLTPAGTFPTGGSGNPVSEAGDPPFDPLASQGALILSHNKRLLFAVNAGSNEISVLEIRRNGLALVGKVASGGVRPISLTLHENLLYVLNEGGTPNITGFIVRDEDDNGPSGGALTPLAGSSRPLTAASASDPAQVGFSFDGEFLAVTDKASNLIDTYTVGANGLASGPRSNPSNSPTPFGFEFNKRDNLIVSEIGGGPTLGAVSSYTVSTNGILSVVSGSVGNSQTAVCWLVITGDGRYAFVSNPGSSSVSSYRIDPQGTLTLLNSVAGNINGPGLDMALSNNSRYLYVHAAASQGIAAFRVEKDGRLTPINGVGGLPFGAQGIAAR